MLQKYKQQIRKQTKIIHSLFKKKYLLINTAKFRHKDLERNSRARLYLDSDWSKNCNVNACAKVRNCLANQWIYITKKIYKYKNERIKLENFILTYL